MTRPVVVTRRTNRTHPAPTPLETPCCLWQGAIRPFGYGRRWVDGRKWYMHRWIWEQIYGPIPKGMEVMHRCDNPSCYRLDHLLLGTRKDNAADCAAKGRTRNGRRPRRDLCKNEHPIAERDGHRWCPTCAKDAATRRRPNAKQHRKR